MKDPLQTTANTKAQGKITALFSGVARVTGCTGVRYHEVLADQNGAPRGIVIGFSEDTADVVLFDETMSSGDTLYTTGKPFSIPVSDAYTGRVVDGLGLPLDGLSAITGDQAPVFAEAVPIMEREPISQPLTTGIKLLDADSGS